MAGDPKSDQAPFFLVAGMFGNVLNLRHFALLLAGDRPVYGIQARGLVEGEAPHTNFVDMAGAYLTEVRHIQPTGPYLIGGFSGGGLAAYEMCQQLANDGEEIAMLVMLDTPVAHRRAMSKQDKLLYHGHRLRERGVKYLATAVRDSIEWKRAARDNGGMPSSTSDAQTAAIETAFYGALRQYETAPWAGDVYLYRPQLTSKYRVAGGRYVNEDQEFQAEDNGLDAVHRRRASCDRGAWQPRLYGAGAQRAGPCQKGARRHGRDRGRRVARPNLGYRSDRPSTPFEIGKRLVT